jgi:hypothetical protein
LTPRNNEKNIGIKEEAIHIICTYGYKVYMKKIEIFSASSIIYVIIFYNIEVKIKVSHNKPRWTKWFWIG